MSIAALDLNLLLVLHTVLLEQNVARAAARLHVTPSAVSNALARLRDALGDPLVTRKGRGIVPTPRALELGPAIARAMRELEQALDAAPFDPQNSTRVFTLAVADVGQVAWVPELVTALQRELPRARLRVVGIDALVALGDLGSAEIDLHVGMPGAGPGLHVLALREEPSLLVARRGHALAGRKLSRRAVGALGHVRVEMVPSRSFKDPFAALFARAKLTRAVVVSVPSFSAAAEIVARSELCTMLPSSLLAAKAKSLGLCALHAPLPPHVTKFAMSWHDRTHADPAARYFRELVRRVATAKKRE